MLHSALQTGDRNRPHLQLDHQSINQRYETSLPHIAHMRRGWTATFLLSRPLAHIQSMWIIHICALSEAETQMACVDHTQHYTFTELPIPNPKLPRFPHTERQPAGTKSTSGTSIHTSPETRWQRRRA